MFKYLKKEIANGFQSKSVYNQLITILCVCFCPRREAACQNQRTCIYFSDLNSKSIPSFQLISAFVPLFPLFFPPLFSRQTLFWDRRCSSNVNRCVWVCVFYVCMCVLGGWWGYVGGFPVLSVWQRKLPSEWDSEKPTRHSMSECVGPGILNRLMCVCICVCVYE